MLSTIISYIAIIKNKLYDTKSIVIIYIKRNNSSICTNSINVTIIL